MDFKSKDFFIFNKEQRTGLVLLLGLIIIMQLLYFFVDFSSNNIATKESEKWMAMQTEIDSAATITHESSYKIYPFNPNFMTDFKAYKLGLKTEEIDRLLAFRKINKYVNSVQEFQNITKVSDSLLAVISPYFKFPDWVKNKKQYQYQTFEKTDYPKKEKTVILDINQASKEDLIKIYGVGEAISDRILKQKEALGAFVSMDQMQDIWGLSPEVLTQLNSHFKTLTSTLVKKIDINNTSVKELTNFPYFRYALAREIVTYRSMNNGIKNIEDLTKIKGFPVDKIKIIALYLEF
jgi:DNA uptake protein ComE-like DNA-binding protein